MWRVQIELANYTYTGQSPFVSLVSLYCFGQARLAGRLLGLGHKTPLTLYDEHMGDIQKQSIAYTKFQVFLKSPAFFLMERGR
jgi:hypothetical protein